MGLQPLGRLALGEAGRVPADERLERGVGRVADGEHATAGPDQGRGVEPAAYGLLRGAEVDPAEGQPGVEQHDGGVAGLGDGFRARGGDDDVGPVGDGGADPLAAGGADGGRREGAAELLGGAGVAQHRGAQAAVAALGAGPAVVDDPAPAAARVASSATRWRAGRVQVVAAGRRTAALAGEAGDVAEARRLDEDRTRLQPGADRRGRPRRGSGRCGRGGRGAARCRWRRRRLTVTRSRTTARGGAISLGPARAQEVRRLDGAAEPADQRGGVLVLGAVAAASRGCGGRARGARRGDRRRRPRSPRGRGRGRARSWRRGCRRRCGGRPG